MIKYPDYPMSPNAHTMIEEAQRIICSIIDETPEIHRAEFERELERLEVCKKTLIQFITFNNNLLLEKVESEWLNYSKINSLDPDNAILKKIYMDASQTKALYIAELEGLLSGDPNLTADPSTRHHWYKMASQYGDKMYKENERLKALLNEKLSKTAYNNPKNK